MARRFRPSAGLSFELMSAYGTKLTIWDVRSSAAVGRKADMKCSVRAFPVLTRSGQVMWTVSLCLDVGRFDDRPPFFDLGFVIERKRLRRLLVWRWNLLALLSKSLPHYWVG